MKKKMVYVVEIEYNDFFVFETYMSAFNFAIQRAEEICRIEDMEYKIIYQENVPDGREPITSTPLEIVVKSIIDDENLNITVYQKELKY